MAKKETKKILCDIVFLSHTCGLNHERLMLTQKEIDDPKKAVKKAFDGEKFNPGMGDDCLIKPVAPAGYVLCEVVYEHRHGNETKVVWLPGDYMNTDESLILTAVFDVDFEPDREEFLTIIPVEEPEFKVIDLGK